MSGALLKDIGRCESNKADRQSRGNVILYYDLHSLYVFGLSASAVWSSGMISASGARGPGFNSGGSPFPFF